MTDSLFKRAGYFKPSEAAYRLFTIVFSLLLLTLSLPVFLAIALVIVLQDKGPIFYKGIRLGRHKEPFSMYKFRTMVPDAENLIGAELFSRSLDTGQSVLTKSGKFLRETRLDELPQLINTIKGDMDLLGPRPLRPAIYEKFCAHIKGFDKRFEVRPGLFGFSQLFTPHSSPKRIRNLIDNRFLKIRNRYTVEVFLLLYALAVLLGRLAVYCVRAGKAAVKEVARTSKEKRRYARRGAKNIKAFIRPAGEPGNGTSIEADLKDINEEALCLYTDQKVGGGPLDITLVMTIRKQRRRRMAKKKARCSGTVFREIPSDIRDHKYCYVLKFSPLSPFNSYVVHQYFLHESII